MSVLVELNDVGLTYRRGPVRVEALRAVSGRVAAGTTVALVGPSGSGKSSLLHLIAGLETPTSGTVAWTGLGGEPRPAPTMVGLVFQAPSLIPDLDVHGNVALPLLLAGREEPEADAQAIAALAELDLLDLHAAMPDELSGGQAQRVALARALAAEPNLLLADEPTGQLDRATAARVAAVLLRIAETPGRSVVISTHDLELAERFAERWTVRDGAVAVGTATS